MKLSREESAGVPTLAEAFPALFSKSAPAIERSSFLIYAASLLRFHPVEAAMILVDGRRPMQVGNRVAFVSGYSVLTTLQKTKPENSYRAFFERSDRSAIAMAPMRFTRTLRDLLSVFLESRFGFTAVSEGEMFAMIGLSDVLGLFKRDTLGSDLAVGDVASQPVAVEPGTTVRDALKLMLELRIRRVFIKGTNTFVSDRELVSNIFSPRKLLEIKRSPGTMLEGTVLDVGPVQAVEIEVDMPLKEAASRVVQSQGFALICDKGVVSPWDMVMKPFITGHLNVR